MGLFGAAHGWEKGGGGQKNPLSSADINIFPPEISKFAISKNTDIDCIFINNF